LSKGRPSEDLADLYENAPCGDISLSPDAHIVRINATLARWLGVPAEQLLDRPFHELLSFGGRIAYETHLAPMLRLQGEVPEIALDLALPNGGRLPVIANAAEKRGPDGEHLFTRMILFRAVERRAYERSLLQAKEVAESATKAGQDEALLRDQFIAVMAHDIRNPLAALTAGVHLIERGESLSDRGRMLTREMKAAAARAATLVDNVLDLARGQLGRGLALKRDSKEPLLPVLEQVIGEMRIVAPDREILSDLRIDDPVDCDRSRMAQLASNLIANAVTHGTSDLPIRVEARTDDDSFTFAVSNQGPPIPSAARERLFQPFFRGAVSRSQQGLGLGLYIVNEIAKAHGGEMAVESGEELTRFTFTMPLDRSNGSPPAA
jgi:sigma-B regulation protein RsbU (phosphoserine phosphatase)